MRPLRVGDPGCGVGGKGERRVGDAGAADKGKANVVGELGVGEVDEPIESVPVFTGSSRLGERLDRQGDVS